MASPYITRHTVNKAEGRGRCVGLPKNTRKGEGEIWNVFGTKPFQTLHTCFQYSEATGQSKKRCLGHSRMVEQDRQ